jgi:hypothetical protein
VRLLIHDLCGRRLRTLLDGGILAAGEQPRSWVGRNDEGRILAAGVYLARLATAKGHRTRKLALL